MSATFTWECDNGAATGSPPSGFVRTNPATEFGWKNIDDATTAFTAAQITAGNNSYERFIFARFSGSFTTILSGLFGHTAGAFPASTTLKGAVSTTYTTPSTTANASLTNDLTSAVTIGSGLPVLFGATGPQAAGKAASSVANPTFSQYLITQVRTTGAASPGNSPVMTMTLQYQEN